MVEIQTPRNWQKTCFRFNRILSFEYRATWKSNYTLRYVRPLQLLFDNGAWYLYAFSNKGKGMRIYSLPCIRNIVIQKETFTYSASVDFRLRVDNSFFLGLILKKKT